MPGLFKRRNRIRRRRSTCLPPWRTCADRKRLYTLTFFMFFTFASSPAMAETCKISHSPTNIKIDVDYGKVNYNNGHSVLQISTKFGRHLSRESENIGLTRSSFRWSLSYEVGGIQSRKNRFCVVLNNLTLKTGYDQFRVYIARRYKPGSCRYRTTLDHENTHVRISQSTLRKYIPRFRQQLRQLSKRYSPIEATSIKSALRQIKSGIRRGFEPVVEKMHREIKQAHSRIDTPENYLREQKLCPPDRR